MVYLGYSLTRTKNQIPSLLSDGIISIDKKNYDLSILKQKKVNEMQNI